MATVSIQVPMLETKLPVHTVANARCRNGRNGDTRFGWAGLVTRPGYPDPGPPALGLRPPSPVPRPSATPARSRRCRSSRRRHRARRRLEDWRPASEDAAAGGAEHRDRPGALLGSDILKRSPDREVEEAVVVEVVQEEPAGQGPPEVV